MILHLLRMRRNVNRNDFNDRKNVSATARLKYCRDVTVGVSSSGFAPLLRRAAER